MCDQCPNFSVFCQEGYGCALATDEQETTVVIDEIPF